MYISEPGIISWGIATTCRQPLCNTATCAKNSTNQYVKFTLQHTCSVLKLETWFSMYFCAKIAHLFFLCVCNNVANKNLHDVTHVKRFTRQASATCTCMYMYTLTTKAAASIYGPSQLRNLGGDTTMYMHALMYAPFCTHMYMYMYLNSA